MIILCVFIMFEQFSVIISVATKDVHINKFNTYSQKTLLKNFFKSVIAILMSKTSSPDYTIIISYLN